MEIKIAEPIQTLEYLRDSGVFPFSTKEGVLYTAGSIDVAISTVKKYQKIKDIVINGDDVHYKLLMQIRKVIEDSGCPLVEIKENKDAI